MPHRVVTPGGGAGLRTLCETLDSIDSSLNRTPPVPPISRSPETTHPSPGFQTS